MIQGYRRVRGQVGGVKSLIVTLVVIIGGGLLFLALEFGTITPCGILHAQLRKEAAQEGGLGVLLSAIPDGVIDAILEAQFGPMSPGRCLQLALSGAPVPNQPAPRADPLQAGQRQAQIEAAQRQAQIEATQIANLQHLTERLSAFTAKADATLPKFAPIEDRYRYITQRMHAALAREEMLYGNGQASVARGQISVAINQASVGANQFQMGVRSSYQDFDVNSGQLARESVMANQACRGAHPVTVSTPAPAGHEQWNASCLHFINAAR